MQTVEGATSELQPPRSVLHTSSIDPTPPVLEIWTCLYICRVAGRHLSRRGVGFKY